MTNLPDIIIPHHNRHDLIGTCLSKIPMEYKVFIVRGFTFAKACNHGASLSKADYLLFLNDDVILTKEALDELQKHDEDVIGLPLRIPNLNKTVYGMNMYWGKYGNKTTLVDSVKTQLGFESSGTCQIPATGAAFAIKRKVFEKFGGFFDEYKNGGEDNELFLKVMESGYSFGFIDSICDHLHSSSEGRYVYDDENHELLTKHFPKERLLRILNRHISTDALISVIIPTREEKKEPFSLKFIKEQTHKNIEIIIIRDTEKKGASWARNEGRKKSKGSYLFFCDDDIELKPITLEVLLTKLYYSNASIAYCNYQRKGRLTGQVKGIPWDVNVLKNQNYISTMSMIKEKDFPKEGFDESLVRFQDWDLWLTMAEQGKYGIHINETLFTAYYEEGDISCNPVNIQIAGEKIKEKHYKFITNTNNMTIKTGETIKRAISSSQEETSEEEKKNTNLKIEIGAKNPVFVQGDYKHVDINNFPHTEYKADSFSSIPLEDNSVGTIFSKRIIQRLSKKESLLALKEWHRILSPSGSIRLVMADIKKVMGKYLQTFENKYLDLLYGTQEDGTEFYSNGYSVDILKKVLQEAGFVNIREVTPNIDYFNPQTDFILDADKSKK
jgi:glycosyltransferase involved in cell wall biosynthesis